MTANLQPLEKTGRPVARADRALLRAHNSLCFHFGTAGRAAASALFRFGGGYCPVCEKRVLRFLPHGKPLRAAARCPHCGSMERHRADLLFFRRKTDLFADAEPRRLLHVAPEPCMEARLRAIKNIDYLSCDLADPLAMERFDLCDIPHRDGCFDIIYCSHVLEHIPDDRRAIAEMRRVLKPGGWALLQVPVIAAKTFEDAAIVSPEDRERAYGQADHVRICGEDYIARLRDAGFAAELFRISDVASPAGAPRFGLDEAQVFFFCRK